MDGISSILGIILFLFSIVCLYKLFSGISNDNIQVESLIVNLAEKTIRKEKMNSDDFRKNKEYFRDIVGKYSPTLLSYIDDFNLDLPRDIIGNIIILEQKGYIKVNNGIFINDNKNFDENTLSKIEKYLLKSIKNGKLIVDYSVIKKIILQEGVEKKLLKINNVSLKFVYFEFIPLCLVGIVYFMVDFFGLMDYKIDLIFILIMSLVSCICVFRICYRLIKKMEPFYRTKLGEDINRKLEGLKVYLNDYSEMKNKTSDMIAIGDDYLIYSIIFHQNNIAIAKYQNYIKIQ